ncbi:COBRA-like protein 7 [Musa troglodytarum]|uniref:COBRA-like protein 7 n=1 Tax=Musa troglodytarum TaxID=320322 RepID=A0A9E7JEJ6_9LILI|nr:COBRA-like protein 7 [Musa troglodytarum]
MGWCSRPSLALLLVVLSLSVGGSRSQRTPTAGVATPPAPAPVPVPTPAPAPSPDSFCNGIYLSYVLERREKIHPFTSDPAAQPYAFSATATVLNHGAADLLSWTLLIPFRHRELIVSVGGGVLTNGSVFPYNTTLDAKATAFSGYPNTDLKTAIETANDRSQIEAKITIVGTLFGSPPPALPLPQFLALGDPSYSCPRPTAYNDSNLVDTCCVPDPDYVPEVTNVTGFLPRRSGDLTISYDVLQSYGSSYLALVTLENHSPLGRLDHWQLSWEWARGEFIYSMKGAYPSVVDSSDCIFGKQGQYYQSLDFSKVLSCKRNPTIVDLTPWRYNDTDLGRIPHCCRNGTILPPEMDPDQAVSAFQIQVYKMPPDLNRSVLFPPINWNISGTLNPDYQCGQPIRVSPTAFPDPSGLSSDSLALASWQVVCNISRPKGASPKCCVSFSAFYNDSVIPCKTCACGCPASNRGRTCNAKAQAMLLPPEALLVPFDNRTAKALAWADIKHYSVPSPLPCGDNCGVSINWHVLTNYDKGWSARVTLFNWREDQFADWFLAVKMDKAYPGYEQMYSFNGTAMGDNTIFMQGLPGLNYLNGEVNGTNPDTDPRVPGKQQSVISFTKTKTPGIDIIGGGGYPSKVYFNGEECSIPDLIPANWAFRSSGVGVLRLALLLFASALMLWEL